MAHTRTWNAAYEASPPNTQDANQGATRIRELKLDIKERLALDHVMDETDDDGYHKQVTLEEQGSAPGNLANKFRLYALDDGGDTELYIKDDSGNELQITEDGKLKIINTQNSWTKGQATTESTITYAATIVPDASLSNAFKVTLTGNVTLDKPTSMISGQVLTIRFIQDGTGGRTLTFDTGDFKGNSSDDLALSTGAGDIDLLILYYDGTDVYVLNLKKDIGNAL